MLHTLISFFVDKDPQVVKTRNLIGGALFVAFMIALAFKMPWADIAGVLRTANLVLIGIAFLLSLPYQALTALNFKIITDQHDFRLSVGRIMLINLTISFYSLVLPASLVGSGLRFYRYSKYSDKPVEAIASITYHKVFTTSMVILLCLGFLIFPNLDLVQDRYLLVGLMVLVIAAILLLIPRVSVLVLQHIREPEPQQKKAKLVASLQKYAVRMLAAFAEVGKMKMKDQLQIIFVGLLAQTIQLTAYFLIARGVGIQQSFPVLATVFTLTFLAANLPFNFSVGISLRELSLGALLAAIGVDVVHAVAMPLVLYARLVFYGLVGGVIEGFQFLKRS
jgi:uncharacterized protein (TIRG00374 family)